MKRTLPKKSETLGWSTCSQTWPPSMLRKIRSSTALTATSTLRLSAATPVSGPVWVTLSESQVTPPSVVCQIQLVVVKSPLIVAHPSLSFRNERSEVFEHVSQEIDSWMIERDQVPPPSVE